MGGERIILGAMSGTSADGVDLAAVRVSGVGHDLRCRFLAHEHAPYDATLREDLLRVRASGLAGLGELARLAEAITLAHARAALALLHGAGIALGEVAAIAVHGQTLYHEPPLTLQWIDPSLLAFETGLRVVSDFRRADCAAGGQGAPLVPLADWLLFRDPVRTRVLLNLGGIANLTILPAGAGLERVRAFDAGPGNCLSDAICRRRLPHGPGYDVDGAMALRGRVLEPVVHRMLGEGFFARPPPRSTDGPQMLALFDAALQACGAADAEASDLLATACAAAARAILPHVPGDAELFGSGGGMSNACLRRELQRGRAAIRSTVDLGVPSQAKEAVAFALLGAMTLDGLPGNVPSATGAARGVVLGSITPPP